MRRIRRDLKNPTIKRIVREQLSGQATGAGILSSSSMGDFFRKLILPVIAFFIAFLLFTFLNNSNLLSLSLFEKKSEKTTPAAQEQSQTTEKSPPPAQTPQKQPQKTVQPVIRKIQVEVLNGCGVAGVAGKTTKYLRTKDIDVVSFGNYKSKSVKNTFLIDRSGNKDRALKVAKLMGLETAQIQTKPDENLQLDVTVVLGKDYAKLNPFLK